VRLSFLLHRCDDAAISICKTKTSFSSSSSKKKHCTNIKFKSNSPHFFFSLTINTYDAFERAQHEKEDDDDDEEEN
jgi:hypothetical protein